VYQARAKKGRKKRRADGDVDELSIGEAQSLALLHGAPSPVSDDALANAEIARLRRANEDLKTQMYAQQMAVRQLTDTLSNMAVAEVPRISPASCIFLNCRVAHPNTEYLSLFRTTLPKIRGTLWRDLVHELSPSLCPTASGADVGEMAGTLLVRPDGSVFECSQTVHLFRDGETIEAVVISVDQRTIRERPDLDTRRPYLGPSPVRALMPEGPAEGMDTVALKPEWVSAMDLELLELLQDDSINAETLIDQGTVGGLTAAMATMPGDASPAAALVPGSQGSSPLPGDVDALVSSYLKEEES
jgi:hypothetical protein